MTFVFNTIVSLTIDTREDDIIIINFGSRKCIIDALLFISNIKRVWSIMIIIIVILLLPIIITTLMNLVFTSF